MARIPTRILKTYLSGGSTQSRACLRIGESYHGRKIPHGAASRVTDEARSVHTEAATPAADFTLQPFRKQLKDETKRRKAVGAPKILKKSTAERNEDWELTVGIEIHAQLNTERKLFSTASSTISDEPNTQVAFFDLAIPGSQPIFQKATLIPALRAALAFNCDIQRTSRFDRKHYFHWDQPSGYQITQYYEPFAKDGYITLYAHDGIAKEDGDEVRIGIKQIQMEQDTAKTIAQPGGTHLLDFNRAGQPLIEIITLPQIHHPSTAAAVVRKIQTLLNAVDACVVGMESGGLRADVNVSVRRRNADGEDKGHEYAGVRGLGQRTEIKNLGSIKAVKDAIIAERDRQIRILEAGGRIEGETRGWTLGSSETKRLRGKEGEVDYRYMPDPDLSPVIIGQDLLDHLKKTMGVLPDEELRLLTDEYGLTIKDAMSLVALDSGARAEYFYNVVDELSKMGLPGADQRDLGKTCGNWVLHELGGLAGDSSAASDVLKIDIEGNCVVPAKTLAQIIYHLETKAITGKTAKALLTSVLDNATNGVSMDVDSLIDQENLWLRPMSDEEYDILARSVLDEKIVEQILKGQDGKVMHLVGRMMRTGEDGRVEPQRAEKVLRAIINGQRS